MVSKPRTRRKNHPPEGGSRIINFSISQFASVFLFFKYFVLPNRKHKFSPWPHAPRRPSSSLARIAPAFVLPQTGTIVRSLFLAGARSGSCLQGDNLHYWPFHSHLFAALDQSCARLCVLVILKQVSVSRVVIVHICMVVRVRVCLCVCVFVCMCVCFLVLLCLCLCVCVSECLCVCVCLRVRV